MLAFRTEVCASAYAPEWSTSLGCPWRHAGMPCLFLSCAPAFTSLETPAGSGSRLMGAAGRTEMSLADLAAPLVASAAFRVAGRNGPAIILPALFGRGAGTVEAFMEDSSRPQRTHLAVQPGLASRVRGSEQLGHIGHIENLARHGAHPSQQRTHTERGPQIPEGTLCPIHPLTWQSEARPCAIGTVGRSQTFRALHSNASPCAPTASAAALALEAGQHMTMFRRASSQCASADITHTSWHGLCARAPRARSQKPLVSQPRCMIPLMDDRREPQATWNWGWIARAVLAERAHTRCVR